MIIKSILKNTLLGLGGTMAVMTPVIALSACSTGNPVEGNGFSKDKIGVYVEQTWRSTFEKAIKIYNEQATGRTEIQLLEMPAFDAVGLVDTLGFNDQKVADLIYMPLDRIPVLSQDKKALMAFDTVDKLTDGMEVSIFDTDGDKTASSAEKAAFANVGKGNVQVGDVTKDAYFAFNHNVEALIAYTKGTATAATTLDQVINETNTDKWANSMYSAEFFNLWPSLGFIGGFLGTQDGAAVGNALMKFNETTGKYESSMANIAGTGKLTAEVQQLKDLVIFIANSINQAAVHGQDWMVQGGDVFYSQTEKLFKEKANGLIIDGPWNKNKWAATGVDVKAVPNIIADKTYTQAPGGWVYGINARNSKDEKRVADMKDFLDILLTSKEVVADQYNNIGKVIAGAEAKKILEDKTVITEAFDQKLIAAVYQGVANSMNARPDNGNSKFSNVWAAWDEAGFRDKANQDELKKITGFNADIVVQNIAKSFENVLKRLNTK